MLKNVFVQAALIAVVLTGGSIGIGLAAGWIEAVNWIEVAAVFTSYACTYLCVKQSRWNYPIGAVSTAIYAFVFWTSGLLGSAGLNIWLCGQLVYGWFRWGNDKATRPVTHVTLKSLPLYLLATGAMFAGGYFIINAFGGTLAPLDAGILILTLLAQWMLDNKKIETWYVWAAVNVLAIYVYFTAGLFLVGVQYIFFLANTIYGWYCWKKSMAPVSETVLPTAPVVQNA